MDFNLSWLPETYIVLGSTGYAYLLIVDWLGGCKFTPTRRKLPFCLKSESAFRGSQDRFKFWLHDYGCLVQGVAKLWPPCELLFSGFHFTQQ